MGGTWPTGEYQNPQILELYKAGEFIAGKYQLRSVLGAGGMGTVWGPVLGACLLVPLAEYMRTAFGGGGRGIHLLIYGFIIIMIAVYEPRGLIGIMKKIRKM